ncbi:17714_t:CDS:2 [Entrophospora sp. SA101]|nr:17714_t:CDS:2 [Entrophospora sp. SA101]
MTPTLWKFTQELASLNKINDIDKEKIKCISIHATTNAAVEHFILSDNDQKNEISDNKPNGSETKKHSLGQDEELTSIKRKQMDVESPNVDIKSVTKNRYVLKWNFEEDLRPARVEWIIDEISISESFFSLKEHAISMANEHKLTYSNHPGEMLSVLLGIELHTSLGREFYSCKVEHSFRHSEKGLQTNEGYVLKT